MVTREMEHVKGLYDYSRFSQLAYKEKLNADRSRRQTQYLLILFVNALLLGAAIWYWQSRKREVERQKYSQTLRMLARTKKDLTREISD